MRMGRTVVAALVLMASLGTAQPARAAFLEDAGWGVLTVLSNVIYMPSKIVYATLGGITGGFAFALTGGDIDTANTVWGPSLGGTYVLTPSMLRGDEPIHFAPATSPSTEAPSDTADGADTLGNGGGTGAIQDQQIGDDAAVH